MKTTRFCHSQTRLWFGHLALFILFNSGSLPLALAGSGTNAPVATAARADSAATTNLVANPTTNAAPKAADSDDEEDLGGGKHSFKLDIKTDHDPSDSGLMGEFIDDLIPLAGITATFGTPILIVFFISYFKFRRRRENLALAREYLNKGLTVPPELLYLAQDGMDFSTLKKGADGFGNDLRKGFRLTFIGLGLATAFWVTSPHSTMWGWGLIPMIMGIGFLISGWVGSWRNSTRHDDPTNTQPSSRNPP